MQAPETDDELEARLAREMDSYCEIDEKWCKFFEKYVYPRDYRKSLDVLGLVPPNTRDEIRTAYVALAKLHHPDRGGDADQFARATKAYRFVMEQRELFGIV
jgi:hypothetical protein